MPLANMDFMDRPPNQYDPTDVKSMKHEIIRLRLENKDFAAELEKIQNMLIFHELIFNICLIITSIFGTRGRMKKEIWDQYMVNSGVTGTLKRPLLLFSESQKE